ncbi:MAG TPA: hypothetical protein VJ802_12270 [Gemmatimonadaceae bacterium]|nr:hypothetical protein [Gemmatimonadaceae bacterium]
MATRTREALLVALPAAEAEQTLDEVLAERGFERAEPAPALPTEPTERSEARFFAVDAVQPALSVIREWSGYSDVTPWGAALELAEGLPAAARMEMALPPALSVLARALSRRAAVIGFAAREKPAHFVGVAFRGGRAADVITMVKDRMVIGVTGEPRSCTPAEARVHLQGWLGQYGVDPATTELLLGERDLASRWSVAYLHE